MNHSHFARLGLLCGVACLLGLGLLAPLANAQDKQTVEWEGKEGPGKGKNIVFVAGANEYNPESGLPILARILGERYGFHTTVCFTINKDGAIDPNTNSNLPGLEALDKADLMVILCRFRSPVDEQMKHIVDYVEAGKPVIGLRTATHSFQGIKGQYAKWNWNNKDKDFDGGFGRQVLGETWIDHLGPNASTSTRGIFAEGAASNPILRGIKDGEIFGTTGVYKVRPLLDNCKKVLMGQVTEGKNPDGKAVETFHNGFKPNDPMQPVAWTRTYEITPGKVGKVFTTTMGSAGDMQNEAFRRMMVNATFWAVGLEDKIPETANVDFIGPKMPWKPGIKPAEMQAQAE